MSHPPKLDEIRQVLEEEGLQAGLGVLNARVAHRFTAVYRLDANVLRNIAIVDKLGELVPDHLLAVPLASSFCQFVLRDGFFKRMGNPDARLNGHPFEEAVLSYVGVPLTQDGGDLIGTFCHFDFPAISIADEEFEFMRKVAIALPRYLTKPGTRFGEGSASLLPFLKQQAMERLGPTPPPIPRKPGSQ